MNQQEIIIITTLTKISFHNSNAYQFTSCIMLVDYRLNLQTMVKEENFIFARIKRFERKKIPLKQEKL